MQMSNAECRPEMGSASQQWQMLICNGECWVSILNVGQQSKVQMSNAECWPEMGNASQ
jgi:hypothetical protein